MRTWRDKDPVSRVIAGIYLTGQIVLLHRHRDNAPFFMVDVRSGGRIGHRVFPDNWALGLGQREANCADCRQLFRTDDPHEIFCLACLRVMQAPGEGEEHGQHRGVRWKHEDRGVGRRRR